MKKSDSRKIGDSVIISLNSLMNTKCRILFGGGLTINPDGRILLCCASTKKELAHISDIDNLLDFFNSSLLNEIRNTMESGSLPDEWCYSCIRKRTDNQTAPIDDWVLRQLSPPEENQKTYQIKFLEFAPSNICNQTCVMCGSVYSSKWVEWDKEAVNRGMTFRNSWRDRNRIREMKVHSMSKEDLQKIYDVLPTVERIHLKGGEPFADNRNYDLMQHCLQLENPPVITATTNFALMTDKFMDIICDYPNFHMSVSIDGTNKLYEWVRGSSYQRTINNLKMFMASTGKKPIISCTPNLFTLYSLDTYLQEMKDLGIERLQFNYCGSPNYVSVEADENIEFYNNKYKEFLQTFEGIQIGRPEYLYTRKYNNVEKHKVTSWIDFMNEKRGFDVREIVPELSKF